MGSDSAQLHLFDKLEENDKYILIAAVVCSLILRCLVSLIEIPGDYVKFLLPWIEEYRTYGFFEGLGKTIGNYYVPYNVLLNIIARIPVTPWILIVAISVIMEYVGAYYLCLIVMKARYDSHGKLSNKYMKLVRILYIAVIFFPLFILDSTIWRQCDSIYVAFCLMGMYYMMSKCNHKAFILFGIAFSFKLQTVFILPFTFAYMVCTNKNIIKAIIYYFYIPAVYIVCGLPAVIAGRSVTDTYGVYLGQTDTYESMACVVPSIYYHILTDYSKYKLVAIGITGVLMIGFVIVCYLMRSKLKAEDWLYICAMMTWSVVFFLPAMHERYVYMPMMFLLAVAIAHRRRVFAPMIIANIIVLYSCFIYLTGHSLEFMKLMPRPSLVYIVAYFWALGDFIHYMVLRNRA